MPRNIFENIVVQHYEKQTHFEFCQYTSIRFFEVLMIEEGKGTLVINQHKIPYEGKQLFIFVPNDKYVLYATEETSTSTIKFLNSFFINGSEGTTQEQHNWFKEIETILMSSNRTSHVPLQKETEMKHLDALFSVMCQEYNEDGLRSKTIIENTLHSILHIVSRNVGLDRVKTNTSKIQDIINYIHLNIYETNKLNNKTLADQFNISATYISQYFKKEMDISLKKYILSYKVNLAENRLKYTDLTLSEIASELGFTDSSHLDKTYVSYKGITPGAFRQQQRGLAN